MDDRDREQAFLLRVERLRSTPEFRTEVDALSIEQLEKTFNALFAVLPESAMAALKAGRPERLHALAASQKALVRAVAYSAEFLDRRKVRKAGN